LKNVVRVLGALGVIALGIWLWLTLFPSPEKVIKRRFQKLASAATVRAGEGALPRLAGAQSVAGFFATNVEINIDIPGHPQRATLTRDDISQALMAAQFPNGLKVRFPDVFASVGADGLNAQADVTAEATAPGDQTYMLQEMKITLQKIDGAWLITKVQTVRTFN
jgi:hypothetical protein